MSPLESLAACLLLGVALGAVHFGGLWLTVNRAVHAANPAAWFVGSALLRMTLLLVCFRLVLRGGWQSAAACAVGLLLARVVLTRIVRAAS